ncbi:PREDICTED: uncharacterized protein LOC104803771 [Tarenaya hassleriana]|uniref:uncharacterized protein LOC104803771 n=1 Tax=Tarenaya hassleriana TaxID=28532 RepID=UPI00053C1A7B|nr:PREDICTED: uncharacterized protein LOC104803771 [Tarenaya hassleriana]
MFQSPSKKKWNVSFSSSSSYREVIVLGNNKSCREQRGSSDDASKRLRFSWKVIWRKMMMMKGTSAFSRSSSVKVASYEPSDYWLNFDQGSGSHEPENLSRSFSSRFADPTRSRRGGLL